MPEITVFGWLHTVAGITALLAGFSCLAKHYFIQSVTTSGKIYLGCTLFTALSALAIFQHGGFGIAHILAVMTLLALVAGWITEKTQLLGHFSAYFQALCYSATLLFHMIPAITDGLMRLPIGDPVVSSIEDPLLRRFYLAFLLIFALGYFAQIIVLRRRGVNQPLINCQT